MSQIIYLHGEKAAELTPVKKGDSAPDFTLKDQADHEIRLSNLTKPVLISIFPDINTRVCSLQTKRFNVEASEHKEIEFLSLSNNTAEEQRSWCAAEGVEMKVLADDGRFGEAYHLVLTEGPMAGRLARAIYVVKDGEISYAQVLDEIGEEPDYQAALAAALK